MMRLIDADALSAQAEYDSIFRLVIPYHRLVNAPTVEAEPVVRAHWVNKGGRWTCFKCGEKSLLGLESNVGGSKEFCHVRSNYCPHCGEHMDEEADSNA